MALKNKIKKNLKLIYVSEFQDYKNHENLFLAIKLNNKINISLDCFGKIDDHKYRMFKKKFNLKKANIKIFHQLKHNKIMRIYKKYDALIFPSLCESFGFPVFEAAINKLPIICSNLQIFSKFFGDNCFYFNPESNKSIVNAINKFSKIKKSEISKKVSSNYSICKKVTWKNCGNNYIKFINNLL